jgi:hypothetical protein
MSRHAIAFVVLALSTAGLAAQAQAQVVDDFMCSSFSYKCNGGPKLPPPSLAPDVAPLAPAKAVHAVRKHAPKHKAAAKSEPAGASDPAK